MKIMVLNSSGSVGKSTITRELFAPRLNNPLIVEVEGQNKSSKDFRPNSKYYDVWVFDGDFDNFYLKLIENQDVIVDVGASQLQNFFSGLEKVSGIESLFDYFIVPTLSNDKAVEDTAKTVVFLRNYNIEDEKIKVIFNAVKRDVESEFKLLLDAFKAINFKYDRDLFIRDNKVFNELGIMRKTLLDVYNPDLNAYKERILNEKDPKKKIALVKVDMANRLGHTAIDDLDFVFEKISGQKDVFKNKFKAKAPSVEKEVKKEVEEVNAAEDDDL